jgi:hypothetical protein
MTDLATALAVPLGNCPWSRFEPGTIEFCERRLCAWIVEPSNTWSNLAYIAVGVYLLWVCRHDRRNALTAVGVTGVLVGIGSSIFHGTGTFFGEVLDVSAMYLISGLFVTFNVKRLLGWDDRKLIQLYVALSAASIALLIATKYSGIPVFALQLVAAGVMEIKLFRRHRRERRPDSYRPMTYLIIAFAVAFTFWRLDISGRLCDPDNHILTGHAAWHISNSLCLLFFYRFHRQFQRREP